MYIQGAGKIAAGDKRFPLHLSLNFNKKSKEGQTLSLSMTSSSSNTKKQQKNMKKEHVWDSLGKSDAMIIFVYTATPHAGGYIKRKCFYPSSVPNS